MHKLTSFILAGLLALCVVLPVQAKGDEASNRVVEVKTAHELIAAIASNTTIKLAPGRYVLSDAVKGAVNANNGTSCMEKADGPQLDITGVRNLTIEGGDNVAEYQIVTGTTYAEVMNFSECEGIKLVGLTMGYTQPGEGSGNVLHCTGCQNIEIENCDLYGSGLYGIVAEFVQGLKMTGGTIRDCSAYLKLADIKGASFTGVLMARKNDETSGAAIYLSEGMNAPVADVVFDRVNFVSDGSHEKSLLFTGTCGEGFTVKNCTSRGVNGKEIPLDLGTNLSPKQIDGLGFNGEIIKTTR